MSKEFTKEIDGKLMICTTDIQVGDDVYEPGLEFEGLIRVVDVPPEETDFSKKPTSWLLFDKAISEGAYKVVREVSIPTAFDFWVSRKGTEDADICQDLIDFAKLHAAAALKAASKTDYVLDSDQAQRDILNCYPLDNIK